jgi:hypothetical protein
MNDYLGDWNRRVKSLRERILLIKVSQEEDNKIVCDILSHTDNQYTIQITLLPTDIQVKCSCPDFSMRKVTCKHIYWLGYKKMGYKTPQEWNKETVLNLVDSHLYNVIGRNDTCPICLESIDYNNEQTICCESECHNSVHQICWIRYFMTAYNRKCVVCRSWGMPEI